MHKKFHVTFVANGEMYSWYPVHLQSEQQMSSFYNVFSICFLDLQYFILTFKLNC